MHEERLSTAVNRRLWLQRSGLGIGALGLTSLLVDSSLADSADDPLRAKSPHFPGRAKRVIQFFLNGGPSHVDTFDPKPALHKYAGRSVPQTLTTERKTGAAFPSPFKFRKYGQSGLEISEIFDRTATYADDIAVIRSMYAQVPNHEPSLMLMNCGNSVQPRPSIGAWVLYGLGMDNQNLPGFVAMCPGGYPIKDAENWQAGFLPGAYQGTFIDPKNETIERLIENIRSPHASLATQRQQLDLLQQLNAVHRKTRTDARLDARIQTFELAFRMQVEASEAFDLTRETQATIDMYGSGVHGRQTLIARRLVERGVKYVQLWHGAGQPWDNHDKIENNHRRLAAEIDRPIAALISDLKQRGLFDETLILWGGEFGRTPTVELGGDGNSLLGRDHNHYGFSVWMAGGGIRGGTTYGATDELGFAAVENRTSVHDLHATMLHLLGFNHERLTFRYAGRDFRLTDVEGRVIHELLA
ncbi:MAG: DUF1501 domain-containing protein [Planctomycetales bacterium]|nr:DUF1501 domain-containing protein [Planctomycetales bacterium]